MDKRQVVKIINKFIRELRRHNITCERIILYGSYASGRVRPDSDIDVAIVSRDFGKDIVEERMRLFRLAGKIDNRLEPVPITAESYENDTWVPLIYEIREKGVELKVA
ncbi:MAG: nucleotidyltransferase domain-containing protein [Nitrospirae bacterium]|nr:nucleotidyltransferase domain-containing protein [Nitrospirota bacterium]